MFLVRICFGYVQDLLGIGCECFLCQKYRTSVLSVLRICCFQGFAGFGSMHFGGLRRQFRSADNEGRASRSGQQGV